MGELGVERESVLAIGSYCFVVVGYLFIGFFLRPAKSLSSFDLQCVQVSLARTSTQIAVNRSGRKIASLPWNFRSLRWRGHWFDRPDNFRREKSGGRSIDLADKRRGRPRSILIATPASREA